VLLYGSVLTHAALGIWSLYRRRYVGWTPREIVQLVLGLCVPALLANHLAVTRGALVLFDIDKAYAQELATLWVVIPWLGYLQIAALLAAWTHGCIGLHSAFALKRWYARARISLLILTALVPILALLGYAAAAREVVRHMADPAWAASNLGPRQTGTDAQIGFMFSLRNWFITAYALLIVAVVALRGVRVWLERGRRGVAIHYPDGRTARIPIGLSVLEGSRMIGYPHAAVCGGRGRCSTCRVRVTRGTEAVPAPAPSERAVLARVGEDPDFVRLGCQLRPRADVQVMPLVPPALARSFIVGRPHLPLGEERFVVAMFVDLRGSTELAEGRLPHDAVFLVRRFVETVAECVVAAGGMPNQFMGDGVLALFGLDTTPPRATRQALDALHALAAAIRDLGRATEQELAYSPRCGVGIHCGTAVVGEIGFGEHRTFTALGDVVNVAARLESATRGASCDAIVSDDVFRTAGVEWSGDGNPRFPLRGRAEPIAVQLLNFDRMLTNAAAAPV
jgi:adenylate cyclase